MTSGTSQGLFVVVAIVIFGIFVVLLNTVLGSQGLSGNLQDLFTTAIENVLHEKEHVYTWDKEVHATGKFIGYREDTGQPLFEKGIGHGEFIQYTDLSPIFDLHGAGKYQLSFDLKASKPGNVEVYAQNGTQTEYQWNRHVINATTEYQSFDVTIDVYLKDESIEKSMLAFWGRYGTEVLPSIKNVKLYKIIPKQ